MDDHTSSLSKRPKNKGVSQPSVAKLSERLQMLIQETRDLSNELQPFIDLEDEYPGIRVMKEGAEEQKTHEPKQAKRKRNGKIKPVTYSLAEICEMKGIELSSEQMARLAYSVSGAFRTLKHRTPLRENRPTTDGKWVARRNVYTEDEIPLVESALMELDL